MTGNVLQLRVSGRARRDVTVGKGIDFPVVLTPALTPALSQERPRWLDNNAIVGISMICLRYHSVGTKMGKMHSTFWSLC